MQWSTYQNGVFDFVASGKGHGFVNAGPGSGKTTVIEEAVKRVPSSESVLVAAFNVDIRDELESRLGYLPNVTVHNFNRFGNQLVRQNVRGYVKVDKDKTINILFFECFNGKNTSEADKKLYYRIRRPVERIVALCKAHMIWRPFPDHTEHLMSEYDIDLPKDVDFGTLHNYVVDVISKSWDKTNKIDFDDQLAMPLYFGWDIPTFNRVLVDEAQDLNPVQIELMIRAIAPDGRSLWVGDPHQAIYQFRGADKHAIKSIINRQAAVVLPLSICYRCSKAVVAEASKIYPDIEVSPSAMEGSVTTIQRHEFRSMVDDGDFVLCRTGSPLVSECLELIAGGKLARVKGKDLGDDLEALLPKVDTGISEFIEGLKTEYEPIIARLQAAGKGDKAVNIEDRMDCLIALGSACESTEGIRKKIQEIFAKDVKKGITLMTVHKSKGLETNRVYILHPELMPHPRSTDPEAEMNIKWVATTRAKSDLVYVVEPPNETRTKVN